MFRLRFFIPLILFLILVPFSTSLFSVDDKFYNYYDEGLDYMEKGDWERAFV